MIYRATTSIFMKFWNDCASVVNSCWNSEWYAPHTLRIRIHGLTQYCLRLCVAYASCWLEYSQRQL